MTNPNNTELDARVATYEFREIGEISTPFKQKFGIPRQSQSLSTAKGIIRFSSDINPANACRGLDAFSHLWISFIFHKNIQAGWTDTVRPPRLGGNEKVGVFASRSTFRPNPIGLSVVKNLGLNDNNELVVEGVDLLDNTPIIDIKPYIKYADRIEHAVSGFADQAPNQSMRIEYSATAAKQLACIALEHNDFQSLLENVLQQDPRPAYKKEASDSKTYSVLLHKYDVSWQVIDSINYVIDIRSV